MILRKLLFGMLFSTLLISCKTVDVLIEIKKKKATVNSYSLGDKEIKFIPMHHLGKEDFYVDVREKVLKLKSEGYIVFYEFVKPSENVDSVTKDLNRRKMRRIRGFDGTYKEVFSKIGLFNKCIQQPSYEILGTDDKDIRADVTWEQFITEWEKVNGLVMLDSVDVNTPFNSTYKMRRNYTRAQKDKIILDYRNSYLANMIKETTNKKILVIYGKGHRKGVFKLLSKTN
jgi:hypothetical protein